MKHIKLFENWDEAKFQGAANASKGYGNAPTISKEEASKLLATGIDGLTDDQVIDLCRYFILNTVPYPMQIKRSIDAAMKSRKLNPYKEK